MLDSILWILYLIMKGVTEIRGFTVFEANNFIQCFIEWRKMWSSSPTPPPPPPFMGAGGERHISHPHDASPSIIELWISLSTSTFDTPPRHNTTKRDLTNNHPKNPWNFTFQIILLSKNVWIKVWKYISLCDVYPQKTSSHSKITLKIYRLRNRRLFYAFHI